MKRTAFLPLLFLLAALSCRKENKQEKNYLRLNLDGTSIECSRAIQASGDAIRYTNLPTQLLYVSGGLNLENTKGDIEPELFDYKNTTGEWVLNSPGKATVWLEKTTGTGAIVSETYVARGNETKLTITEVDDRYIRGSFSFVAYMNTGPGVNVQKRVTGGAFAIKRNP